MTAGSVRAGRAPLVRVIVRSPEPGIEKVIVSAPGVAFAFAIAWRSEPAPASAVVVTVKVAARAAGARAAAARIAAIAGSLPLPMLRVSCYAGPSARWKPRDFAREGASSSRACAPDRRPDGARSPRRRA